MSKLQEYLYDQYALVLLGSEIDDILALARQEIELPSETEIEDEFPVIEYQKKADDVFLIRTDHNNAFDLFKEYSSRAESNKFKQEGALWALGKVQNPYPKPLSKTDMKENPLLRIVSHSLDQINLLFEHRAHWEKLNLPEAEHYVRDQEFNRMLDHHMSVMKDFILVWYKTQLDNE